jgi:hypothetical protein
MDLTGRDVIFLAGSYQVRLHSSDVRNVLHDVLSGHAPLTKALPGHVDDSQGLDAKRRWFVPVLGLWLEARSAGFR